VEIQYELYRVVDSPEEFMPVVLGFGGLGKLRCVITLGHKPNLNWADVKFSRLFAELG
jgi:hypothetical protein